MQVPAARRSPSSAIQQRAQHWPGSHVPNALQRQHAFAQFGQRRRRAHLDLNQQVVVTGHAVAALHFGHRGQQRHHVIAVESVGVTHDQEGAKAVVGCAQSPGALGDHATGFQPTQALLHRWWAEAGAAADRGRG